eukprot:CAMPEP_0198284114 /NCGR_PEP_ID=MMETSP1449-20131203/3619_1 /TAXON_ID=420275 /ORGANISM="Attheya septentrionalis, Strain CCMP2084" /LENGTH=734 /DNA_ID=CAMNT_0043981031 /DNA_START=56 /DNA_END=2260 /DNA_ORIENTATION=+
MTKVTSSPKIVFDRKFSKRSSEQGENRNGNTSIVKKSRRLYSTRHIHKLMKLTSSPKIMFDKKFSKRSSEKGEKRHGKIRRSHSARHIHTMKKPTNSSPKIMFDRKFFKRSSEKGEKRNGNSSAITTLKTTRHTSPGMQYSIANFLFAKRDKDSSPSSETVSTDSNDDSTKLSSDSLSRGTNPVKKTSKTVPPPPPPPQEDDVSHDGQIDHVSSYGSSLEDEEEEEDEDQVESDMSEESNSHQAGDHQQLKLSSWPTLEAILSEKLDSHETLTSTAEPEQYDLGDEEHEFYVQHLDTILENDEEGSSKTLKPSSEDSSSDEVATEKSTDSGYFSTSNSIASKKNDVDLAYPMPGEASSSERVSENYDKDEPGFKIYMPISETERLKWILVSSPLLVQKTISREKARTKSLDGIMIQHWKDNTIQKKDEADGFWLPLEGPSPNLDNSIEFDLQIPWENQWEAFVPNLSPLALPGLSDRNNHIDNENTGDSVELPSAFDMTSIQEVHKSVQESLSEGRFESVLCMLKDNLLPALIRENQEPCSAFCGILPIAATMKNIATLQMYLGLHRDATAFLWEACIFSGISIASCEADNEDDENSDCIKLLKAYNMIYLMWLGISLCALEKYEDSNMVFLKVLFQLQGEKTMSVSTEADDERHKLMSRVLTNIGATFLEMRDYERAQRTLERADALDSNIHTRYLLKYCKYSGVSNRSNASPKLSSRRKLYTPGNNRSNEIS